jgi:death-on-curing protein
VSRRYITVPEVENIHDTVLHQFGGLRGFRDKGLVESAVGRVHTGYYDTNIFKEAAALMDSLANNHGFIDGNKRTAFVSTDTFLRWNGFYLEVGAKEANDLITRAIAEHVFHYDLILEWVFDIHERLDGRRA